MIPLIVTFSSPPTLSLSSPFLPPSLLSNLNHTHTYGRKLLNQKLKKVQQRRRGICKAELQQDAPFAIAIGACMLNSLIFPISGVSSSEDEDAAVSSSDARFSVMTIISLIPYFNWLSWVFALMDTGKRRYALYAAVYLAPYLRTNLSLSPEESWLPIASIVLCIVHIQLEASIYSGDLDGFKIIHEAVKRLGLGENLSHVDDIQKKSKQARNRGNMKLPLGNQSGDEIRKWRVPRKHSQDLESVEKDDDEDDRKQH